jgi:hypothetical protein
MEANQTAGSRALDADWPRQTVFVDKREAAAHSEIDLSKPNKRDGGGFMSDSRLALSDRPTVFELNRRLLLAGGAALTVVSALSTKARAQSPDAGSIENPLLGTTFVGLASDGLTHVAVVQIIGAESAEVRCYLCDGLGRSDWLTGPMVDGPVPLESDGVSVQLVFADATVTGEATLGDGTTLTFEAAESPGPAGLYEVGPIADQLLAGSATSGALVQLQVVGALPDDSRLLSGLTAWPDGSVYPLAFLASPDAGGELRIIVVPGGSAAGGPRVAQGVSRGIGAVSTSVQLTVPSWTDPDPTPWIDPDPDPWIDPEPSP